MSGIGDLGELWVGGGRPGSLDADAVQRAIEGLRAQTDALLEAVRLEPVRYIGTAGQPAFQGLWVNNDAGTPGVAPMRAAGFYRHGRHVELVGVIKTGLNATVAFTLPVGYRPLVDENFAVDASGAPAIVQVRVNGDVVPFNRAAGSAVTTFCFLNGVRCRIAG